MLRKYNLWVWMDHCNRGSGGVAYKEQRKEEWFGLKYELDGSHFVRRFLVEKIW